MSVPSSITLKQKQGTNKTDLRFLTYHAWVIPEDYQDLYEQYFLIYWEPQHLKSQIREGCITRATQFKYQVQYHNCTPEQAFKSTGQVALSFRAPKAETGLLPVVLVSCSRT